MLKDFLVMHRSIQKRLSQEANAHIIFASVLSHYHYAGPRLLFRGMHQYAQYPTTTFPSLACRSHHSQPFVDASVERLLWDVSFVSVWSEERNGWSALEAHATSFLL